MQTRLGDDLHHSHGSTSRVNDHWATGAYARTTHAGLRMRMHVHSDPVVVHPMLPMQSHSHQQHPRPPGPALFDGVEYLDDEVDGTPGWTVHPDRGCPGRRVSSAQSTRRICGDHCDQRAGWTYRSHTACGVREPAADTVSSIVRVWPRPPSSSDCASGRGGEQ